MSCPEEFLDITQPDQDQAAGHAAYTHNRRPLLLFWLGVPIAVAMLVKLRKVGSIVVDLGRAVENTRKTATQTARLCRHNKTALAKEPRFLCGSDGADLTNKAETPQAPSRRLDTRC